MSDAGAFGYSQQGPQDYGSDNAMIEFIARQLIAQMATVKIVKVVAVHPGAGDPPAAGTVDVLPLVNQMDGRGFTVKHETVFGLRYIRLQAGPWAIVADPAVNDVGLILCADRDSSALAVSGAQATPGSFRRHNIADGIYLGGLLNAAPLAFFNLKSDGSLKISDRNGNVLTTGVGGFALTGDVAVTGNISASGTIIAGQGGGDQVGLQTHVHSANNTPPTPGS